MKPKTVVLLAVAVGSGLLAMIGVQQAMSGSQSHTEEMVKVAYALSDIDIGFPLSEENVGFKDVPLTSLAGFNDPVLKPEQYDRRSPLYPLKAGDLVRVSKLSEPGATGKSLQIPMGMRVLTISVDDTGNMAGLLRPGDRVDVMVTYASRDNKGRQNSKTTTLLEYVEIFATDDRTAKEADAADGKKTARTVGLLLSPENVPYLKLAETKGKLSLSWRRRDDDEIASVGPINEELLDELRGLDQNTSGSDFNTFAPPLYGGPEGGEFPSSVPKSDFGGLAAHETATPPPAAPPSDQLDSMLSAAEAPKAAAPATPPQVVAAVPVAPPKPTWKLQIYSGSAPVTQEFELPEEPKPEGAKGGSQLWTLFKQVL